MARIRSIKPEFFRHVELYEAEKATGLPLRVAYAGLWTVADREGRFRWRPRVLVLDVLPFDEVDFAAVLDALAEHGFIVRYEVGAEQFGFIPSFGSHQHVNQREPASSLPGPDGARASTCENIPAHGEGKGREEEGKGSGNARPHAIPDDWKPEEADYSEPEAKRFAADSRAKGKMRVDWQAEWEVWKSRIADYGEAVQPKATSPPAPTTWLSAADPRWADAAGRYQRERGKPLRAFQSKHFPEIGAAVPTDWLEPRAH